MIYCSCYTPHNKTFTVWPEKIKKNGQIVRFIAYWLIITGKKRTFAVK